MLWFASWLIGHDGQEGGWFHSARGEKTVTVQVPSNATGVRIRRWPSEGLDPEYVDVELDDRPSEIWVDAIDFGTTQRFSRLPQRPEFALRGVDS